MADGYAVLSRGGTSCFCIPVCKGCLVCDLMVNERLISDFFFYFIVLNLFGNFILTHPSTLLFCSPLTQQGMEDARGLCVVGLGASSHRRFLFSEEASIFNGKMMVPILFPLQPSQSSPSSETCQLISCKSRGFADSRCRAALFLRLSIAPWMHDSNTAEGLRIRAGDLQRKTFSLQTERWDLVPGDVQSLCCGCPL